MHQAKVGLVGSPNERVFILKDNSLIVKKAITMKNPVYLLHKRYGKGTETARHGYGMACLWLVVLVVAQLTIQRLNHVPFFPFFCFVILMFCIERAVLICGSYKEVILEVLVSVELCFC